jgi:hypothetical protein
VPLLTVALGALLVVAGLVLLFDFGGAARALIRGVTSRSLGSLAPGYAADPRGMRVYAVLVAGLGLAILGAGVVGAGGAPAAAAIGLGALAAGVAVFLVASVLVIAGEVRTYRALPRPPTR